jgi:hypothetical protein
MRKLITSTLLAVLLIDMAGSIQPTMYHNQHPPHGVRRMIKTLENGRRSPSQCSLEQSNGAAASADQNS